jgi:hypothetical protein
MLHGNASEASAQAFHSKSPDTHVPSRLHRAPFHCNPYCKGVMTPNVFYQIGDRNHHLTVSKHYD